MRGAISIGFFFLIFSCVKGQKIDWTWYSEMETNGVIIQNSYPKGGPYPWPTKKHFNYSFLVFFTRVINETESPLEIMVNFSADSIAIPNSPNTYVKLFLPSDTMTLDKQSLYSYGITELVSMDKPTRSQKKLYPKEDCLFYVVAIFYQTIEDAWRQERGGNRAELILKGEDFYYNMTPQVDSLACGHIIINK